MREVIQVHIGQFGLQLGAACWETLCGEHFISSHDGKSITKQDQSQEDIGNRSVLFHECQNSKYTPRALFVDLERDTIDQVRKKQGLLHHPSNFNFTKDGGTFATRAHYTVGKEVLPAVMDRTRILLEQCDCLEGFIFHRSISGGTGSGLGSLLQERFDADFGNKLTSQLCLFPSPRMSTEIVESYNAVLAFYDNINNLTFVLDNEQLYNLCVRNIGIPDPSYVHINELLAKLNSYLTLSSRFGGPTNVSLKELQTNLVCYPRLHYIQTALAPLSSTPPDPSESAEDATNRLIKEILNPRNIMSSCNTETKGVNIASSALFAGVTSPTQMIQSVSLQSPATPWWDSSKCKFGFISRSPGSFPKSENSNNPSSVLEFKKHIEEFPESGALFMNHTSMRRKLRIMTSQFDLLYSRRAFVHWYLGEGLSSGEFCECRENVEQLILDYDHLEKSSEESTF